MEPEVKKEVDVAGGGGGGGEGGEEEDEVEARFRLFTAK